jgi:hypothetical protein
MTSNGRSIRHHNAGETTASPIATNQDRGATSKRPSGSRTARKCSLRLAPELGNIRQTLTVGSAEAIARYASQGIR